MICHQNAEASYTRGHEKKKKQKISVSAVEIGATAARHVNRNLVGSYSQASLEEGDEMLNGAIECMLVELKHDKGPDLSFWHKIKSPPKHNNHDKHSDLGKHNDLDRHNHHDRHSNRSRHQVDSQNMDFVPLEVSQQVVAGMNYKIKIGVFMAASNRKSPNPQSFLEMKKRAQREPCLGGISATIFRNLQGEYSVTAWGEEFDCGQVLVMMSDEEEDE